MNSAKFIFTKSHALLLLSLAVLIFIVFGQVMSYEFTNWDDDKYVTGSLLIREFSISAAFSSFTVGLYTPLVTLSYMLDYKFFGLNPAGFHAVNLMLHLINTFLVYALVFVISNNRQAAFVTALLFAIHPLHVEPVVWISSRKDVLFTAFYLMASMAYLRSMNTNSRQFYVAAFLLFAFSCLSKPAAVTFPVAVLTLGYLAGIKIDKKQVLLMLPFLLVSGAVVFVGVKAASQLNLRMVPETGYDTFTYLSMAAYGQVFYIIKTFLPFALTHYHAYPLPGQPLSIDYKIALPVLILVMVVVFFLYKNDKKYAACLAFFLLALLPTFRFVPIGFPLVADRYFYLSSLGIFMMVGIAAGKLWSTGNNKIPLAIIGSLITVFMTYLSIRQTATWKNSISLWKHNIKVYPELYYSHEQLGKYYLNERRDTANALFYINRSLALQPQNADLAGLAGSLLLQKGNEKEAYKVLDATVKQDSTAITVYNRANALKAAGQITEAIKEYDVALSMDSSVAHAYNNRGVCKVLTGDTLGAYADFTKAVTLIPGEKLFVDNKMRIQQMMKGEK